MNHWLQQATAPGPAKPQSTPPSHNRKAGQRGKAFNWVRTLVQRQPLDTWFSAADVFDGTICSDSYAREILKGMAERGELVSEFRNVKREYATQVAQSRNKWMFKREK